MQAYHARLTKLLSGDEGGLIHSDIEKASLDSVAEALSLSKGQVSDTVKCCIKYCIFCVWSSVTAVTVVVLPYIGRFRTIGDGLNEQIIHYFILLLIVILEPDWPKSFGGIYWPIRFRF